MANTVLYSTIIISKILVGIKFSVTFPFEIYYFIDEIVEIFII